MPAIENMTFEEKPATLNSGIICFDTSRHWDLVGLWAFSVHHQHVQKTAGLPSPFASYGDQNGLNTVSPLLGKGHDLRATLIFEPCDRRDAHLHR